MSFPKTSFWQRVRDYPRLCGALHFGFAFQDGLASARLAVEAFQILAGQGSIVEAARFFVKEQSRATLPDITIPKLADKLLESVKSQGKSARYIQDLESRLPVITTAFSISVRDLKTADLNAWLQSLNGAARTKNNYRGTLNTLLSFARSEGYLPRDVKHEGEHSKDSKAGVSVIGIYSPEEFKILLSGLTGDLRLFVAIAGYAGLRSAEIVRLEWADVHLDHGEIEVKAGDAKTGSNRFVPILPPLLKILQKAQQKAGRVLAGMKDEFDLSRRFTREAGKLETADCQKFKTRHNGLRHSFGTYRTAVLKNTAQVSAEMGNSVMMIHKHYRKPVPTVTAKTWFADSAR